ncbi:hypothetical protein Glove_332g28 [Diversispora epigaea]|uniref:Uncharacterized protein n=1 Tax=Diversispora epigaea TaxID=1348612 RepID=A0A397HPQ3_9GLOM|nr:hypothetical protein Glove_332g28 [Diversispora epigaea]
MIGDINNSEVYVADAELSSKERDQEEVQETLDKRNAVPLAWMKLKKRKRSLEKLDREPPQTPVLGDNDDDDEKKEFRYNLRSNKRKNYAEDTLSVDGGLDTMVSLEDIENILENHKTNYEKKNELAEDELEKSLTEADIINISSNKPPLISKEFFSRLKTEAKSRPLLHIKVDEFKKWIQENYDRKITTTISNIQSITTIGDFNVKQVDLIKRILEIKLMQFQVRHVYRDSSAFAHKANGILFNYNSTS